jgi:hypothetical protein
LLSDLQDIVIVLPTDYTEFGGEIDRYRFIDVSCSDCTNCLFFETLASANEWGICAKPDSNRAGLLTHANQAGFKCFTPKGTYK